MAAAQTVINDTIRDTAETSTAKRRRVLAPTGYRGTVWYKIFSTADCYLERVDAADAGDRGTGYETLLANQQHVIAIRRGEFAISNSSASQVIEITAMTRLGPG